MSNLSHRKVHHSLERRRNRSDHPIKALQLQLEYVCQRLSLDALVLSDDLGDPVAAVGREDLVENLSIQSPWIVGRPEWEIDEALSYLWDVYPNLTSDKVSARSIAIEMEGERLILVGIGKSKYLDAWIEHAAVGVNRIIKRALSQRN